MSTGTHLQKVMLAALESLRATMSEGSDASFLEDIIDPEEIGPVDINELENRINGLQPERLVVNMEGGLVQSVCANKVLLSPLEVYINDLDTEGADDEEVSVLKNKEGEEFISCFRKESIETNCAFDIDDNVNNID